MNDYSSHAEGDGIPLLTEVVDVPDAGAASVPSPQSSLSASNAMAHALTATPASLDHDRVDAVLREFRETWPDVIETECRDAVQLALQQIAVQMRETLTANLSVALQMRLEAWLEERLRG